MITPLGGVTPTKPGSASLPFFGIEPAIIDPVSGEEIHGNDVEGVLAIKKPWPSMARTVWGAHKRYMDTYLNVYKGYYVGQPGLYLFVLLTCCSSLATGLAETMKATTGSGAVWMTLSTSPDTDSPQRRSRPLLSSIVSERGCCVREHKLTLGRPSCGSGSRGH